MCTVLCRAVTIQIVILNTRLKAVELAVIVAVLQRPFSLHATFSTFTPTFLSCLLLKSVQTKADYINNHFFWNKKLLMSLIEQRRQE